MNKKSPATINLLDQSTPRALVVNTRSSLSCLKRTIREHLDVLFNSKEEDKTFESTMKLKILNNLPKYLEGKYQIKR
jgi:hypothetical protein